MARTAVGEELLAKVAAYADHLRAGRSQAAAEALQKIEAFADTLASTRHRVGGAFTKFVDEPHLQTEPVRLDPQANEPEPAKPMTLKDCLAKPQVETTFAQSAPLLPNADPAADDNSAVARARQLRQAAESTLQKTQELSRRSGL